MVKLPEGKIFDLKDLVSYFDSRPKEYFLDFLKVRHLEVGIIKLRPGQRDTQTAHDEDELYFVIEGSGMLKLGQSQAEVKAGSVIFVPKGVEHHFFGNDKALIILYVFAEE